MNMALEREEPFTSLDEHMFDLKRLFVAKNIQLSARSEVGRRQLLAFVISSGDLSLHYLSGEPGHLPVMRHIPWFLDSDKRISAMCFDPSGTWLLIAGYDNSLFIIPSLALVDSDVVVDHRWSTTDVTAFPPVAIASGSAIGNFESAHPVSIVWWQSLLDCQHSAIIGNERGDVIFISLTTGAQIGITYIKSSVATLHICQDNSLDTVFLLITDSSRNQWKLLLEQRATGYIWPVETGNLHKGPPSLDLSSSQSSIDLDFSRSSSHYPTTRSRLQGLKQLSVEKLASLRQKLAETRSKGMISAASSSIRRESSSSSSDETASVSNKRKSSTSDLSRVTSGPSPERLSVHVGETFLHPQYTRGRYLLSGYYASSSILTVHGMSLEVVPLFVHKLPPNCRDVLVTDRFLFVTFSNGNELKVISNQLSESRLDGDYEYNPASVVGTFTFGGDEKILVIYKCTESNYHKKEDDRNEDDPSEKPVSDEKRNQKTPTSSPFKDFKVTKIETPVIDSCVVVTTQGVYIVHIRRPVTEVFLELVLKHQELEKAERLAHIFGLNLQELLEHAGDLKLVNKEFPQAIALYKLSRCRHLKSVLKFAACGHSVELLSYINLLFSTSGLDLTTAEKIHLSNLSVLSHTEQVLRNMTGKLSLFKQFLQFLRENLYYDEVLAVNVAGQTGLWEVLQFLASYRGLHQEVLDILTKIMRSHNEQRMVERTRDSGLWLCVTDPSLQQSLLARPQQARIHLHFIDAHLPYLERFALQRLAALYDPSSPSLRLNLRKMFKFQRSRHSSESGSTFSGHLDSIDHIDTGANEEFHFPMENLVQTFLLVLLYLVKKHIPCAWYNYDLVKKIVIQKDSEDEDSDLSPTVPLQVNHLSCGFSHMGLIRNGSVYTWGSAVQGCLGTGPSMSRYGMPQPISIFSSLMLEVCSISCGRRHTLALTNNGVYAWGSSQFGQLGIGKTVQSPYPRLVERLAHEHIVSVSCGQYHSTALAHDGRVFTWGWGVHGQLGHGSVEDVLHPTLVKHLVGKVVTQICGGHGHTVALTAAGEVYTFGSSVFGQLGNGSNMKSSVPVLVSALPEPIALIATGYFHNLAVSCSNKLYTWGSSPQVLRLQAQAQKKARLLQHQTLAQSSLQEQQSSLDNKAVSSVDSSLSPLTETSSSEISNSSSPSVSSSENHEGNCESSSSSQSSVPPIAGNNPVSTNETSLGCSLTVTVQYSQAFSSSEEKDVENIQKQSLVKSDTTTSEVCNSKALKAKLSLDRNILKGTDLRNNSDCSLKKDKNAFVLPNQSGNVSKPPSIFIDEDLSEGLTDSALQADDLELKSSFSPTLPTIVVSPTVEFKGLSAPSVGTNNANFASKNSRQQGAQWDGDEGQAHLIPQLVDTGLVNGTISQISCGCHHSALLTRDGVLYIWGRNLDGQVGNGSRKEVSIPTPLSSTPTVSMKSPMGVSGVIPSIGLDQLRLQYVSCGCEFTAALEASGGKVWAWGNNANAQLGIAPVEDSKPLEGKLVMLKTSKRVIKFPQGMNNSCDIPREVPGVPSSTISFQTDSSDGSCITNEHWADITKDEVCPPLCSIEQPCYGIHTLHYALQHFHGHYDSKHVMNKCLELQNYQAAARLAALDRHYHLALAYQLKAIALSTVGNLQGTKEVNQEEENTKTKKQDTEETRGPANKCNQNVNLGIPPKTAERVDECQNNNTNLTSNTSNTDTVNKENLRHSRKYHIENHEGNKQEGVSPKDSTIQLNGSQNCKPSISKGSHNDKSCVFVEETSSARGKLSGESCSVSVSSTPESVTSSSNPEENEMHTFAIQGGREQMSEDNRLTIPELPSPLVCESRNLQTSVTNNSAVEAETSTKVKPLDESPVAKDDSSASFSSEEQCTVYCNTAKNVVENENKNNSNVYIDKLSNIETLCKSSEERELKGNGNPMGNKGNKPDEMSSQNDKLFKEESDSASSGARKLRIDEEQFQELVVQASLVVEYYVSMMEEDSHSMMSQLLQEGFEFWLSHSLPVDHLEHLLVKHMPKFFYPLGLLLFCNRGISGPDGKLSSSILHHLSARFCLQLCSMLLGHIDQRKSCPDYIELLAEMTTMCVGPNNCLNGCYQGTPQTPEQIMEAVLQDLGGSGSLNEIIEQSFVNLHHEDIKLCEEPHLNCPDQLFVFSCGHRYGSKTFQQTILPEMEMGLLQLHQPLPNTAQLLKGMFNATTPSIHLACPRCLLSHFQSEVS